MIENTKDGLQVQGRDLWSRHAAKVDDGCDLLLPRPRIIPSPSAFPGDTFRIAMLCLLRPAAYGLSDVGSLLYFFCTCVRRLLFLLLPRR